MSLLAGLSGANLVTISLYLNTSVANMANIANLAIMATLWDGIIFWKIQFWRKIGEHLTEFAGGTQNQVIVPAKLV